MVRLSDVVPDTATKKLSQISILDKISNYDQNWLHLRKERDVWNRFKKKKKRSRGKKMKEKREYDFLKKRKDTLIGLLNDDIELCKNSAH